MISITLTPYFSLLYILLPLCDLYNHGWSFFCLTTAVLGCHHWHENISRTPKCLELYSPTFSWCACEGVPGTTGVRPIVCSEAVGGGFSFPPIHMLALAALCSVSHQTEYPLDFFFFKAKYFTFFERNL